MILLAVADNIAVVTLVLVEPESTTLTILNTSDTGSSIFVPTSLVGAVTTNWPLATCASRDCIAAGEPWLPVE